MPTTTLTKDNFDTVVSDKALVLVDFWAEWCGPCRRFGPVFEAAAAQHPDVVFAKVDTEAEPELAASFDISSIPTLMVVRDGVILYSEPGALPSAALDKLIDQARSVDMDDIRRRVAAEQAGA